MQITLKAARVNKGLTQYEAAKLLNIGITTLRRWEKGISQPKVDDIKKMEQIYEINFNNIFFDT